jgi:hypothetical protein|nr:MAG TPA: hypothetical protein [Caudoviricetes sp.]
MKTAKERLYEVDYAEEKFGDTVTKELVNTSEYEKGYGIIQALESCETKGELDVLDEVLTALCGHGIEYLTNLVENNY